MSFRKLAHSALGCSILFSVSACETAQPSTSQVVVAEQSAQLTADTTYVVLYRLELLPFTVNSDIRNAGGTVVATYPNIGVVIARSTSDTFASKLKQNLLIDSVAPTTGAGIVPASLEGLPALSQQTSALAAITPTANASGEPFAGAQWNMKQIHAAEARAVTPGRKSVIVGVVDTGIDDSIPDLQGQVDRTRSVSCVGGVAKGDPALWANDWIGHGSHVAGIIGAKENGIGVAGVAPGVTLAAVQVTDNGLIYPEAFICAMYWAGTHDFDLANASLFTDPWYFNCSNNPVQRTLLTAQQRAINFASRNGVTVVAAAGNEEIDLNHKPANDPFSPTDGDPINQPVGSGCKMAPVELDNVIGVSATGATSRLSFYSNYGLNRIDFTAPGGDFTVPAVGNESGQILSTVPPYSYYYQAAIDWNGRVAVGCTDGKDANDPTSDPATCAQTYAVLQGTSQATPHLTGIAALAISKWGKMGTTLLVTKLSAGATKLDCPANYEPLPGDVAPKSCEGTKYFNGFYGNGLADALRAVQLF